MHKQCTSISEVVRITMNGSACVIDFFHHRVAHRTSSNF